MIQYRKKNLQHHMSIKIIIIIF